MKVKLRIPNPSVDWRAMARIVEKRPDLRDDITMIVEPGGLSFVDENQREVESLRPPLWTSEAIADLSVEMCLLDFIREEFSVCLAA